MPTITGLIARDIRFPTSLNLDGSDALNPSPDYSAAYVVLQTDGGDGPTGHGLTFTTGRGTEVCVGAVNALAPLVVGSTLETIADDMRGFWRRMTEDGQLRWLGPQKGVIHLATAAVVNAVWDLYARVERKPLWQLLAEMSPEQLVSAVDFSYITDALAPDEAVEILRRNEPGRADRIARLREHGFPAYTTSVGWLGYGPDKLRELCRQAVSQGWDAMKMKVGRDTEDAVRRAAIMREEIGFGRRLMMDANQCWEVEEAIANISRLAEFDPWWVEEPTSPDDVLGHARIARAVAPVRIATGEHVQNRIVFKQLLQSDAIRFCQLDCCRLGGINEALAVMLLAAKHDVPICPHAGGVGLCEYGQHLAMFDYICVSGTLENRTLEYVDHLHEHFVEPVVIRNGSYVVPDAPGASVAMHEEAFADYEFPNGAAWQPLETTRA